MDTRTSSSQDQVDADDTQQQRPEQLEDRIARYLVSLRELLINPIIMDGIISQTDVLSHDEKIALSNLADRVWQEDVDVDSDPDDDEGGEKRNKNSRPTRKPKKTARRHQWRPVMKLRELKLPPRIRAYLESHGDSPAHFFEVENKLEGAFEDGYNRNDAFFHCFVRTLSLQQRNEIDTTQMSLLMWALFGMVQKMKPGSKGKVGRLMLRELQGQLDPYLQPGGYGVLSPISQLGVSWDEADRSLRRWCRLGAKIDVLCTACGPGIIFWLGGILSQNFLDNRFTSSGRDWEDALAHLEAIGLRVKQAGDPRVDNLARRVRSALLEPFT